MRRFVMNVMTVVAVLLTTAAVGQAAVVTVGNHSFETEGSGSGDWHDLPVSGAWVVGSANQYRILGLDIDPTHFPSYNTAPDGLNVLYLPNASPLSQDLSTAVAVGDVVTVDFYVGDSVSATYDPGNVTVEITVDGVTESTTVVANNAPSGDFLHKSVQWTATTSGNLGVKFTNTSDDNFIDDVGCEVSTAPSIRGDVEITNWDSVFYTDTDWDNYPDPLYPPTANGYGFVSNNLSQGDDNSYSGGASGSQTYGGSVSWADGSAASDVGTPTDLWYEDPTWGWLIYGRIYPNTAADANLDIDLAGASAGNSATGLTYGAISGTTFDGTDPGGDNGFIAFTVEFTIDALAAGSSVDGSFGIQVDVFNWTLGDLAPVGGTPPYVTGPSIVGSVNMTEQTRTDGVGDAWTFELTAADIAAAGGSVDETYTAHFNFVEPNDPPTENSAFVSITAFAQGEAELPESDGAMFMFR